jgi:hypothetical protein
MFRLHWAVFRWIKLACGNCCVIFSWYGPCVIYFLCLRWPPPSAVLCCSPPSGSRNQHLNFSQSGIYHVGIMHIYHTFLHLLHVSAGARGSVVGWDITLQAGRSRVSFPTRSLDFSIDLILPAAGIFLGAKGRPAREADNLTSICEPVI